MSWLKSTETFGSSVKPRMPFSCLPGRALHRFLDLAGVRRTLGEELEVDHRDVGRRHADGGAVELAGEFRQHEADRLGGARGRRDHRQGGGARAVKVLVHRVQRRLVAGVGVDGRHEALLDADGIVEDLGHGGERVGRAGRVGDHDVVLCQLVVVDPVDDGEVGLVAGRGDQHALGAGVEMLQRLFARGEEARAFERDVHLEFAVGQLLRVADGGDPDRTGADVDRLAFDGDRAGKPAVNAVKAQQVGVGRHRPEVVDRHDLDVGPPGLGDRAQDVAPNASEPVDRNSDRHGCLLCAEACDGTARG